MSYKQATSSSVISTSDIMLIPTIQDTDLDTLLTWMQAKFGDIMPVKSTDLKKKFQQCVVHTILELNLKHDDRFQRFQTNLELKLDTTMSSLAKDNAALKHTINTALEHNYSTLATLVVQMQTNMVIMQSNMILPCKGTPHEKLNSLIPITFFLTSDTSPQDSQDDDSMTNDELYK